MKRPLLVASCIVGAIAIAGLAMLLKPKDPACVKLEARIGLATDFCGGLAERAAKEKCSVLTDNPDVMGQCMHVIVPAAYSGCMEYVNMDAKKEEFKSLCQ